MPAGAGNGYDLVLVRRAGTANPGHVRYVNYRATRADEWLPGAGTLWGHSASLNAQAVAAAPLL